MLAPIWIGLGLLSLGVALLAIFGLVWPKPDSALHNWGFRIGILLTVAGSALAIVFS